MKAKNFSKKNKKILSLLIITFTFLIYFTYMFGWQKEGYHSDENWSYGFANAYYQKQLYEDEDKNVTNFNKWIDTQLFLDYIEVQNDERFAYDSVWYNMSEDYNPPLHSVILHTICSFFPNTFSWWYGYLINIVALIITVFALYYLAEELTHSHNLSLFICIFYMTLSGALSTFIYLRAYALITAFALLYALLHCKIFNRNFEKPLKYWIAIFFLNIIGGLCHYYFLGFVFCFAVIFSLYQLFTKHFKSALIYIGFMTLSGGAYLLIWPYAFNILGNSSEMYTRHMPLLWEVKACFQYLIGESCGFLIQYPNPYTIAIFNVCLIFLTIIIGGFSFIFRNEIWFRRGIRRLRLGIKHFFKRLPKRIKKANPLCLMLTVALLGTLVIIAKASNVLLMGIYFDRYLFFLLPLTTTLVVIIAYKLISKLCKRARKPFKLALISVLVISCLITNYIYFPCHYLFPRNSENPLVEEITKDANVIVTTCSTWHLVCYSTLLKDCNQFYMIDLNSFADSLDALDKLEDADNAPIYLLIEKNNLRSENWKKDENAPEGMLPIQDALAVKYKASDIVREVSDALSATTSEYITTETSFDGDYDLYRIQ